MFTAAFVMEPSQKEGGAFAGERSRGVVSLSENSYPGMRRVRCYVRDGPVQEDEVAAESRDGVLSITLPKTEQAKLKKIAVKS